MLDFEAGVTLGKTLATLQAGHKDHDRRLDTLERDVRTAKDLVVRAALLAALWGAALLTNLPAQTVGELTASFLKAWSK